MASLQEEIVELVTKSPGLTDREITDRLRGKDAAQQPINQAARVLKSKAILRRTKRSDGLIGNYPSGAETPSMSKEPIAQKTTTWTHCLKTKLKKLLINGYKNEAG